MKARAVLACLTAALLLASGEARARSTLELTAEFGLTVPFNKFISSSGKDGDSWVKARNTPGFSFQTSMLLSNWEFHYGLNQVTLGDYRIRFPDWLIQAVQQQTGQQLEKEGSVSPSKVMTFHSINIGYRVYVMNRNGLRLYITDGIGPGIVTTKLIQTSKLFGMSANLGFGVDWQFLKSLPYVVLNSTLRYNFYLTETSQEIFGLGYMTSGNIWKSAYAMMHMLTFNVGVAGRW